MKTSSLRTNAAWSGLALLTIACAVNFGLGARCFGAPAPVWPVDPSAFPKSTAVTPKSTVVAPSILQPLPERERMESSPAKAKALYSFQAQDLDLKTALAIFARANNLNIIPDNDITGTITMDVHGLSLEEMMRAFLESGDCSWREEGGLIRIRNRETRTFSVDYLRLSRKGTGQNSAMLASGNSSGGGGLGGGGSGGGGGGGGSGGGGVTSVGNTSSYGGSSVNLTADNSVDFWKELKVEISFMLTDDGKKTLAINMTAGLIQVTDRPSALKRVENYLNAVTQSVHRQVDIEARLYSVTLNNQFQFGIDWVHAVEAYGGSLAFGGATLPVANGGSQLLDSSLGGLNPFLPTTGQAPTVGANISTLVFSNFNTAAAVNALSQQGNVEVISKPRIRTLNNQTALIKVGEDVPFFNSTTTILPSVSGNTTVQDTVISSITIGTILSITPEISDDDWVVLDISPVLTSLKAVVSAPSGTGAGGTSGGATAPDMDTKMASSLVRVRDGTTVVIGGLIQTQVATNANKIPILGDIPYLGKLFQGTFNSKQKTELVIFVTPHIVRDGENSAAPPAEAELFPKIADKPKAQVYNTVPGQ
jgi:MSHA biogenesis protein MshL